MREAGIHAIIQKIHADAERHGSERYRHLKLETDEEMDSEKALYEDEMSRRREMLRSHNEHEFALLSDRMSSRFHRELLTYRRRLIDEIFDMAASKLRDASEAEFSALFEAAVDGLTGELTLYIGELSQGKQGSIDVPKMRNNGLAINLSPDAIAGKSGFLLTLISTAAKRK